MDNPANLPATSALIGLASIWKPREFPIDPPEPDPDPPEVTVQTITVVDLDGMPLYASDRVQQITELPALGESEGELATGIEMEVLGGVPDSPVVQVMLSYPDLATLFSSYGQSFTINGVEVSLVPAFGGPVLYGFLYPRYATVLYVGTLLEGELVPGVYEVELSGEPEVLTPYTFDAVGMQVDIDPDAELNQIISSSGEVIPGFEVARINLGHLSTLEHGDIPVLIVRFTEYLNVAKLPVNTLLRIGELVFPLLDALQASAGPGTGTYISWEIPEYGPVLDPGPQTIRFDLA